jgi:hypothetical protein
VTITAVEPGRISGEFELEARGFAAANEDDEDKWVTVRGNFRAHGDSPIASARPLSLAR